MTNTYPSSLFHCYQDPKIETIEGMTPLRLKRGRFTVPDKLIASLQTH